MGGYIGISEWDEDGAKEIFGETNLENLYEKCFCYNHISYRTLLRNGQIIKKGKECPDEYNKNCGRIDTLEQELCIKDTQECPLYDISLDKPNDIENYEYDDNEKIYYNKNNYTSPNKTIIGRLMLSDGQPCCKNDERLWRAFSSIEAVGTKIKCDDSYEIYNIYEDKRFIKKGEIAYKKLYEDNLYYQDRDMINIDEIPNITVGLYKREFIGINKEWDIETDLTREIIEDMESSQISQKKLSLAEGIIALFFGILLFSCYTLTILINTPYEKEDQYECLFTFLGYIIFFKIVCIICHIVFFIRMYKGYISFEISDLETNEIIKKGAKYGKYTILFTFIGLILDVLFCFITLIGLLYYFYCRKENNNNNNNNIYYEPKKEDIKHNTSSESKEIPLNTYYNKPYYEDTTS